MPFPLSSTSGVPVNPGCVVPSIVVGPVIAGSGDATVMVCGPEPRAKEMTSAPALALALRIACRSEPAPVSFVFETTKLNGPPTTLVLTATALLAGTGSSSSAWSVNVLPSRAMAPGVPTIPNDAVAPLASVPKVQKRSGVNSHVPDGLVASTLKGPFHRAFRRTLVAGPGPLLVTVTVYDSWPPTTTGSGVSTTDTSISAPTASGVTHAENSDVLFEPSVAVAVTNWPAAAVKSGIVALPVASVVAAVLPRNICPSPLPDASHAVLPKNSIRNVVSGMLLSVPCTPPVALSAPGSWSGCWPPHRCRRGRSG